MSEDPSLLPAPAWSPPLRRSVPWRFQAGANGALMIKVIGAVTYNDRPQASADPGAGELSAFGDILAPRRRAGMCAPSGDPAAVFLRLPGDPGAKIALRQTAAQPIPTERGSFGRRYLRHCGWVPGVGGRLCLDHIFHRRAS